MYVRDTIAAVSTPVGEGGIGIIRVSGPDAERIASTIFRRNRDGGFSSHRFYYGSIVDPEGGALLDEAMAVVMKSPNSYTREDVLELQCHGGYLLVQTVLALVLRLGVRLAEPGEFTKRAFLNGRIDLVQAEAVIDVIRSKTDAALALSQHQREGALSLKLSAVRDTMTHALALVEAHIDFPDEDIDVPALDEIRRLVELAKGEADGLLSGFNEGRVLRDGVAVLIAGKPNVGKSSLLNTLLQEKRAIVTSLPGTTRDIIEEVINMGGLPVKLLDTAGVRRSDDLVEQEGIRRTLEQIPRADLVLFMVDSSRPFDEDDRMIRDAVSSSRVILVRNKADLPDIIDMPDGAFYSGQVSISTLTGSGIDRLRGMIRDAFLHGEAVDSREYVALSQSRHRDVLIRVRRQLDDFLAHLQSGVELPLLSCDLRDALDSLGEVTGETTPDDVLDLIFSRFCIGK